MDSGDDRFIDAIYEAASDPGRWTEVLSLLTIRLCGAGAALHVGDTDCSGFAFGANHNVDPDALSTYGEYYFSINPLNPPLTRQPVGAVIGDDMLITRQEYRRSEYHADYSRRFDIEGSATAVLAKSDGHLACLGVVRGVGAEPYSQSELTFFKRLLPHLQRAVDINRKLAATQAERDGVWGALNAVDLGVALLDQDRKIIMSNATAQVMLQAGDGIRLHKGRVAATSQAANSQLQSFVSDAVAARADRGDTMAIPRPEKRPLHRPHNHSVLRRADVP